MSRTRETRTDEPWYQHDERTQRLRGLLSSGCRMITVELSYALPDGGEPMALRWAGLDMLPYLPAFREFMRCWELRSVAQILDIRVDAAELVSDSDVARNPYVLVVH